MKVRRLLDVYTKKKLCLKKSLLLLNQVLKNIHLRNELLDISYNPTINRYL